LFGLTGRLVRRRPSQASALLGRRRSSLPTRSWYRQLRPLAEHDQFRRPRAVVRRELPFDSPRSVWILPFGGRF